VIAELMLKYDCGGNVSKGDNFIIFY